MTGSRPGPLRVDIGWIPLLQDLNSVYADEIAVVSSVSSVTKIVPPQDTTVHISPGLVRSRVQMIATLVSPL